MPLNTDPRSTELHIPPSRRQLVEALLEELLSWNPREFIMAFRRWHHDSFSLIHLNVLTILEMDGSASMSHLAGALDVSVASMTGIVDRMEKRDLVERRRDDSDRRIVLVHATEAGHDVFRAIDRRRREGLEKMLAQLGEKELAGLLVGHRALRAARSNAMVVPGKESATRESGLSVPVTPPGIHSVSTTSADDRPVTPTRRRRA